MIPVGNIYYMLAYAFRVLELGGFDRLASEPFDNATDLCAAVLAQGVRHQLRRGMGKGYLGRREELSCPRGKIDISASLRRRSPSRRQLVCLYDEFSPDTPMNRVLKATMRLLVRSDASPARRRELRDLLPFFDDVSDIDTHRIDWSFRYDRNNRTYRLLMYVCRLAIDQALARDDQRNDRLEAFGDDQRMHRLYERFLLEYYRREHPELTVSASQIPWALDGCEDALLPVMRSDITLTDGARRLIIDAKYYASTTQERFGIRTLHSGNLYQIFTYVKNAQAACGADSGHAVPPVAGMLLYAKTDEELVPASSYLMSGNPIEVRTLDLSGDFPSIRDQLDGIARQYFPADAPFRQAATT